jgi:hypothetical protein
MVNQLSEGFGPAYLKINSAFKRDTSIPGNPVIPGEWSQPEFAYLADLPWRWTEKIDGTNIRLFWDGLSVTLGGRTDNAQIPARLVEAIADMGLLAPDRYGSKWPAEPNDGSAVAVTLFGEGFGAGIQKGGGNYGDPSFILFDVKIGKWWLEPHAVQEIANEFGINTVPYYGTVSPNLMWEVITHEGLKSAWPAVEMEGVVGTPHVPLATRAGGRLIMKMKQRDWTEYSKVHSVH